MKKDLIIEKQKELIVEYASILHEFISFGGISLITLESELKALESLPEDELYRKVYIKSKEDWPEKGEYFCNRVGFNTIQKLDKNLPDKSYMREIRWYLLRIK